MGDRLAWCCEQDPICLPEKCVALNPRFAQIMILGIADCTCACGIGSGNRNNLNVFIDSPLIINVLVAYTKVTTARVTNELVGYGDSHTETTYLMSQSTKS